MKDDEYPNPNPYGLPPELAIRNPRDPERMAAEREAINRLARRRFDIGRTGPARHLGTDREIDWTDPHTYRR